jgi:hypothetical protein
LKVFLLLDANLSGPEFKTGLFVVVPSDLEDLTSFSWVLFLDGLD